MKYLIHAYILLFAICSCQSKKDNNLPIETITLNLNKKIEFLFLDFITIDTIIHLETKDSSLISAIKKLYFTSNYIYIFDSNQKQILQFKRNGEYVKKIGVNGGGPTEYIKPLDFCVSEKFNKIAVLEDIKRITVYDLNGKFIEKINLTYYFNKIEIVSDKTFICIAYNRPQDYGKKNAFIVNSKGKVLYSGLPYEEYLVGLNRSLDNCITQFDNKLNIIRAFDNTIYTIKNNDINPKYYLDFGKDKLSTEFVKELVSKKGQNNFRQISSELTSSKYVSWISRFSETNNYIYIGFKQKNNFYSLYYSKKTSEIRLYNHNNLHDFFFFLSPLASFKDDTFINVVYPHNLYLETNKFRLDYLKRNNNELYEYVKDIKEEIKPAENPVIVLTKIKKSF